MTDVVIPEISGCDLANNLLSIYLDIRRLFMSDYTVSITSIHGVLDYDVHFMQLLSSTKNLGGKLRESLGG